MKNTPEGISSRLNDAEDLKTEWWKSLKLKRKKERKETKKISEQLSHFVTTSSVQTFTLSVKGVPDGKERKKGAENIFEDL